MQIPILIEPVAGNGFRASSGAPLGLSVEAATRNEALAQMRAQLVGRLENGAELVTVEMPAQKNPWLAMAGIINPADPLIQEWKESMAEYRREVENDPNYL
jgi:hypothetical protein